MKARIRGIYATALTRALLGAGHDVVQASPPIRRRFDADLPPEDHDVAVDTTDDRQGVGIAGDEDAVETCLALAEDVAIDAIGWRDPAPLGTVVDGRVTETLGSGAVVDLGDREGFLPFGNADGYVDDGDAVRVQVRDAAPPWDHDLPTLAGDLRAGAGLATLVPGREGVRVDGQDDAAARELQGLTDLLSVEVPAGWGIKWQRDAVDAEMGVLESALHRAAERAERIEAATDAAGDVAPVRTVVRPGAGAWVWFGREARFALDDVRAEVTTTMPGHHRTKAASRAASAGVDLVEALCDPAGEFPFAVVTDQFGPVEGDTIRIDHGKPDGSRIVLGKGEVVERDPDGTVAVEREMSGGGRYDALGTPRESGDTALTKFREGRWWYPTTYRDADGASRGTYVNVCTPVEAFPEAIRYVDLEVDVVKRPDGTVERVDDDELDEAVADGLLGGDLAEKAREVAAGIERALSE